MTVTPITNKEQFDTLINSGKVIFIDFWATWCGPCRVISPVFERLSAEHAGDNVEFYKVDVDALEDVVAEAGIRAMPTFQVYKNGCKIDELVGAYSAALVTLVQNASM